MAIQILIVEDEPKIAETIIYSAEQQGFFPTRVSTLGEASQKLQHATYDAIILDVGLPDGNGFDFCKQLRQTDQHTPVLFLTARTDEIDRVVGLEIGGDDYIAKPFSPRELMARVKVILKRTSQVKKTEKATKYHLDESKRIISLAQKNLELTKFEYGILKLFLNRPGHVYSRDQIMEHVWEDPDMSLSRAVDTHIKTLRQKLKQADPQNEDLKTHRGVGYSFREKN